MRIVVIEVNRLVLIAGAVLGTVGAATLVAGSVLTTYPDLLGEAGELRTTRPERAAVTAQPTVTKRSDWPANIGPDECLMDLHMPVLGGLDATKLLATTLPTATRSSPRR